MAQYFDNERRGRNRRYPPREEGFFDRVRDWFRERVDDADRDYRRDPYRAYENRDFEREYQGRGIYDPDNAEWERTRQWRRDWRRDWAQRNDQDFDREYSSYPHDYSRDDMRYYQHNYNRDYDSDYDRDWNRSRSRGQRRDYRYQGGAYPSGGMRADYGGRADYSNRYEDDDVNYGTGDIGYEPEGAFYQDLDEPENYRYGAERNSYRGVGPQGYRRSDERINDDIHERLTRHGRVDARQIHVDVKDGEVTLTGKVPYRVMKRLAEDLAENVSGVRDVRNEIRVEEPGWQRRDYRRDYRRDQRQNYQQNRRWQERQDWPESQVEPPRETTSFNTQAGTPADTAIEGLEASGETDYHAASMEDLGAAATTQPTRTQNSIRMEMEVIGSDGKLVGKVKEVRQNDFLIDREMARDIYAPFSAVSNIGEAVMLNVNADDVDMQGWEKPQLF